MSNRVHELRLVVTAEDYDHAPQRASRDTCRPTADAIQRASGLIVSRATGAGRGEGMQGAGSRGLESGGEDPNPLGPNDP
jgi:hypothetical protein